MNLAHQVKRLSNAAQDSGFEASVNLLKARSSLEVALHADDLEQPLAARSICIVAECAVCREVALPLMLKRDDLDRVERRALDVLAFVLDVVSACQRLYNGSNEAIRALCSDVLVGARRKAS